MCMYKLMSMHAVNGYDFGAGSRFGWCSSGFWTEAQEHLTLADLLELVSDKQ